jgi:hypothetical protein
MPPQVPFRAFKTAKLSKDARKAKISDARLCDAIRQVVAGRADDPGGGVFKKRLSDNMYRAIVLAKGGRYWVYEYLFAKKGRENIDDDELAAFRLLAKGYASLTERQVGDLVSNKHFVEICYDDQA